MIIARCTDVKKHFPIRRGYLKEEVGVVKALDGVSIEISKGETVGLVGESGCGKTTLGRIMLEVLKPDSGSVELLTDRPQAIFQDPYASLDPKMKVHDILAEGLILQNQTDGLRERVKDILELIRLPKSALEKYPHQFSGGERQRIAIGRAIITKPEFIVCDEPVSNLDVTIQLQILNLLKDIRKKLSITYFFISHDLKVIKFMCDRVAVMKEGRIIEEGPVEKIYADPATAYAKMLIGSVI